MPREQLVIISPEGQIRLIWDDSLADLCQEGQTRIRRAGHVEPVRGEWFADCRPVGDTVHGPFRLRQEAIDKEIEVVTEKLKEQ